MFAFTDIMIGAGASTLRVNNPVGIGAFLFSVVGFFVFVGWVGYRAKKKLDRIEEEVRLHEVALSWFLSICCSLCTFAFHGVLT